MDNTLVVDATGLIAGRLASIVAKRLLRGESVIIVNAEKAIITGKRERIRDWYLKRVSEWRTHFNPEKKGPKIPKRPDLIMKRMIRNMLPYKKPKGKEALKRLRVYIGTPPELADITKWVPEEARLQNTTLDFVTLMELAKAVGGKVG